MSILYIERADAISTSSVTANPNLDTPVTRDQIPRHQQGGKDSE